MSAHLTVYEMALEAERPLRNGEMERARHLAAVDAALERRTDTFLRRLSDAIHRPWRHGVTAGQLMSTRDSGLTVVGQPAN